MNALAQLQEAIQSFVLDGNARATTAIISTEVLSAAARLEIYGDAYRLRLIEALASNYPRLKQALGNDEFDLLAQRYIEAHRSSHPSIRWYGDRVSEFIATVRSQEPWLAELAKWEWAVAAAFDARDAETIDAAILANLRPEQWSELHLVFHHFRQRPHHTHLSARSQVQNNKYAK